MNALTDFNGDLYLRLSLTLAHTLWQGVLLAILAALIGMVFLRKASPQSRYVLHCVTLLVVAVCPVVNFILIPSPAVPAEAAGAAVEVIPIASESHTSQGSHPSLGMTELVPFVLQSGTSFLESEQSILRGILWSRYAPYVVLLYGFGVILMLARFVIGIRGGQCLRRHSRAPDNPALLQMLERESRRLGLAVAPALAYCERILVPTVVGVLRPVILLPATITTGLSSDQLAMVLRHEQAQLRLLRQHGRPGRPLGSAPFILQLEQTLGRFLRKRKPGPKGPRKPNN